jgi:hypothetical protein
LSLAIAALIFAAAIGGAAFVIATELRAARAEATRTRALTILQAFAPGIEAARADPRALLVWQPLSRAVRQLFPTECAALDQAAGGSFPFTREQVQAAHSKWTTDWLAWERAHDADYKDRAAVAEHELAASNGSPAARARVDAIEREKLDLYQRRYQDYVQVARALQALIEHVPAT